jgi:hypothetical protein
VKVATRYKGYDATDSWSSWDDTSGLSFRSASSGNVNTEFSNTLSDSYKDQNNILSLSDLNIQANRLCQMQFFRVVETTNPDQDEIYLIEIEVQLF